MSKQNELDAFIRTTKTAYKIIEDVISDSIYYDCNKIYVGGLVVILIASIIFPLSLLLLIPFHLILKGVFFFKRRKEYICNRKGRRYWLSLDGWQFEENVAEVLRGVGYTNVNVTKKTGDDGIDIIFYDGKDKCIVQAKHWFKQVPVEPVRALWAVKEDFNADRVIMLASSGVTPASLEFIKRKGNSYVLWTLDNIIRMSRSIKD